MKTIAAVAKIYKGFCILQTMEGFHIAGEEERKFASWDEAAAFVDAVLAASVRLMLVGEAVRQ